MSKATHQQSLSTLAVDDSANSWRDIRLRELLTLHYGTSLPEHVREKGCIPVYGSNGVVGYHCSPCVKGPGIIIGRKGSVGAINWCDTDFWPIDTTYYIEDSDRYDVKWLYYVLDTLELPKLNSATGVPGINRDDIYQKKVCFPPLPEQRRIATVLATVDEAIAATTSVIARYEAVRNVIIEDAISGNIGHNEDGAGDVTDHGEKGWQRDRVGQLLAELLTNGRSVPDSSTGFPVLRLSCIRDGKVDLSERKIGCWTEREATPYLVQTDDFLVVRGNGNLRLVGRGGLIEGPVDPVAFPDTLIRVRLDPRKISTKWLAVVWNSPFVREQIEYLAHTSSGLYKISQKDVAAVSIPLPDLTDQRRLLTIINSFDDRLALERAECNRLVALKKGLMQVLLTGKVRVPPGVAEGVAPAHA